MPCQIIKCLSEKGNGKVMGWGGGAAEDIVSCFLQALSNVGQHSDVGAQGARAVVLMGGNASSAEAMLGRYPHLPADRLLHVTLDSFLHRYDALYRYPFRQSAGCYAMPPPPRMQYS